MEYRRLPYPLSLLLGVTLALSVLPAYLVLLLVHLASGGGLKNPADLFALAARLGLPGRILFSQLIYVTAPYSASIDPLVEMFVPGHSKVSLVERYGLRNPFQSIHAAALGNLGELASGLAVVAELSTRPNTRGIVTRLDTSFFKKARGKIVAKADVPALPDKPGKYPDFKVVTVLMDQAGDRVAETTTYWTFSVRAKEQ